MLEIAQSVKTLHLENLEQEFWSVPFHRRDTLSLSFWCCMVCISLPNVYSLTAFVVQVILPFIPKENPRLSAMTYELVLNFFLVRDTKVKFVKPIASGKELFFFVVSMIDFTTHSFFYHKRCSIRL